jgi:two-component system cell cycle response regulator
MDKPIRIILIEDNAGDARLIEEMLKDVAASTFECEWVATLAAGLRRLSETQFDALLLDLGLPDSDGLRTLETLLSQVPELPIIVLTGLADETTGVEAVQKGAQDFLVKGAVSGDLLLRAVRYAIERKKLMLELRNLSLLDDLTGLYNRRGFFTLAEQQIRSAERDNIGLFFIVADLDGLKEINDTYGHEEGDAAIRDAAKVLKETFRDADVIGRIGGDEFAIVASEKSPASLENITDRIENKIGSIGQDTEHHYKLSISMGLAHSTPETSCSIDDMLKEADKLMYKNKSLKKLQLRGGD